MTIKVEVFSIENLDSDCPVVIFAARQTGHETIFINQPVDGQVTMRGITEMVREAHALLRRRLNETVQNLDEIIN